MFRLKKPSDIFSARQLESIKQAVADAEKLTSGEIRVVVRSKCEKGLSPKEQAIKDFQTHSLDKTADRTGVLILIILNKKQIEVIGDRGINEKVPNGYWEEVVDLITYGFKQREPVVGINAAVKKVGRLLQEKFPLKSGDVNELPNDVVLGK